MASPKTEWALAELFESWAGVPPDLILPLAPSGSDRIYYRLQKNDKVAIGTYSPHAKESLAFLNFNFRASAKNSISRGLEPGQPPSM